VVSSWPLKIIPCDAPPRLREMVLEWAAQHQQELLTVWNRCASGLPPMRIAPLQ